MPTTGLRKLGTAARLLVAAAIGIAIALGFYLLLRIWERLTIQYHIPIWVPYLIEAALFVLFFGGLAVLIRRAKK